MYEIADASGQVVFIGYAGGRSLFGLRSELSAECERRVGAGPNEAGFGFRYEVNMQYLSRWQELLMIHEADWGELPHENERPAGLGRLQPD